MIKKTVLIVCVLITMAFSGPAFGSTYYGYDTWGGTWHDANKTWVGDSLLCWAAASSNILDWAGYDTPAYTNETAIFNDFKSHWSNLGGLPEFGWNWYLNGNNLSQGWPGWSQVIAPGGDNNWPLVPFAGVYHENWNESQAMLAVDSFLHTGYGVTLAIYTSGGGHALTCWGYDYTAAGGYQGVWVTDSDDRATQLAYYPVSMSVGVWNLGGGYNGWHIGGVEALDRNLTGVPEPSIFLLLISGLIGLVGLKRSLKE